MDILIIKAFILGIVEGLTEFLPISSTGHLIIIGDLINFNDDKGKVFEIVIQLAAILAVCWEYRSRLSKVIVQLPSSKTAQNFVLNLIVAFMPAAILGFLFHKSIKTLLFNPTTVAVALIVGGFLILWLEKKKQTPKISTIDDIKWQDSLKIGFCQALAMIPGTSRSGATIIGAIFFGFNRQTATEFSFFLAIPTMFAATCYDLLKSWKLFSAADLPMFVVGFITSFISALLVVRWLIRFVSHNSFNSFAWYRIILGFVVLVYFYH